MPMLKLNTGTRAVPKSSIGLVEVIGSIFLIVEYDHTSHTMGKPVRAKLYTSRTVHVSVGEALNYVTNIVIRYNGAKVFWVVHGTDTELKLNIAMVSKDAIDITTMFTQATKKLTEVLVEMNAHTNIQHKNTDQTTVYDGMMRIVKGVVERRGDEIEKLKQQIVELEEQFEDNRREVKAIDMRIANMNIMLRQLVK